MMGKQPKDNENTNSEGIVDSSLPVKNVENIINRELVNILGDYKFQNANIPHCSVISTHPESEILTRRIQSFLWDQ